jgi:uncharacterized MAPEG superfamily protein
MDPAQYPALPIYAMFAVGLCVFVMGLDGASAGARAKTKTAINPEDANDKNKLVEEERAEVARANRVWRNAFANIVPFLFCGFLFVLTGVAAKTALIYYAVFTGARLLHAVMYLGGKQPWRTLFFVVGQLCTVGMAVQVFLFFIKK